MMLLQAAADAQAQGWGERILAFVDTPAPYSPFSEYLIVLFVLWLIARRAERRSETFDTQAQDVLEEKYAKGEINRKTYDKFRQEMATRLKR